jgi:Hemerythrin HHE cation binding domain
MFNPLEHPGLPVDRHGRHWHELDVEPVDLRGADPYTHSRISAMEGLEAAATRFDRRLTWRVRNTDARRQVGSLGESASVRRGNLVALQPPFGSMLETAMRYEWAALDLVTWVARSEPDAGRAQAYRARALRHLDRLYGCAELCDQAGYRWAGSIVSDVDDLVSAPAAARRRDRPRTAATSSAQLPIVSLLHRWAVGAMQQQVAERFSGVLPGMRPSRGSRPEPEAESVGEADPERYRDADPEGWERLVVHESAACYLYYCFLAQETNRQVRAMWELHLQMELAHLHAATDLLQRSHGRDPQELVGGLPEPMTFERNRPFLLVLQYTDAGPDTGDIEQVQVDGDRNIVDLLTDQHVQIDREFRRAAEATGDDRRTEWGTLARMVAVHEIVEEEIVHPLARRLDPDAHVVDRLLEEERSISDALADAVRADSGGPDDRTVDALRELMRTHARDEERLEFARLRADVPESELREMAGAVSAAERAPTDEPEDMPHIEERVRDAVRPFSRGVMV